MVDADNKGVTGRRARVMLVEDHPVMRHGLATLINDEPDMEVCVGAASAEETMRLLPEAKPDVVIVDISLGQDSGLDLIKRLHAERPGLTMLALSMHDEALYAERALRAGARGYIMKNEAMDRVMTAVRRVLAGEVYISEKMASRMVHKFIGGATPGPLSPVESLSTREFEVFNMIAQSMGPSKIAQTLGVSVKTIETHREHIKEKLGIKNGPELTRFAIQWGMSKP